MAGGRNAFTATERRLRAHSRPSIQQPRRQLRAQSGTWRSKATDRSAALAVDGVPVESTVRGRKQSSTHFATANVDDPSRASCCHLVSKTAARNVNCNRVRKSKLLLTVSTVPIR